MSRDQSRQKAGAEFQTQSQSFPGGRRRGQLCAHGRSQDLGLGEGRQLHANSNQLCLSRDLGTWTYVPATREPGQEDPKSGAGTAECLRLGKLALGVSGTD